MNIGWQEFLGFYTGLNVVRKQYDEKFQEQRGIGEECDDPNNSDEEEAKQQIGGGVQQDNSRGFTMAYKNMAAPANNAANEISQPLLAGGGANIQEE